MLKIKIDELPLKSEDHHSIDGAKQKIHPFTKKKSTCHVFAILAMIYFYMK